MGQFYGEISRVIFFLLSAETVSLFCFARACSFPPRVRYITESSSRESLFRELLCLSFAFFLSFFHAFRVCVRAERDERLFESFREKRVISRVSSLYT